jgi:outer membrane lipoprotein carrier protein
MMGWKTFRRGGRFLLTAALTTGCLCAQQTPPAAPGTAKASSPGVHDLAHRIDQRYNKLHSLKAGFTESYAGLGVHRSESGTLLLLKPGRMRWDYTSPPGKLFLLDGKFAWFYSQGDAQVQRIPEKQLDDLRSPLRFLLGHTELEKELTGITLTAASNGQFTLTGQPKGQEKRIPRLALTVTPAGAITGIEIEEIDGAITRFTFSDEVPDAAIPPGAFHFNPLPGVPVIDTHAPE